VPLTTEHDTRGFIRLSIEGVWPSVDELKLARAAVAKEILATARVLLDIRKASGPLPKYDSIRDMIGSFDLSDERSRARKRAVLVSSDVQFGVARTFQAILPGKMEVFRDEADALVWLLAK
jgi:hypothetical protein